MDLIDFINYLLSGTDYLHDNEHVVKLELYDDGTISCVTNLGRQIPSDIIENL